MHWFEGGIAEAICASKAKKAVFVVFVAGSDDASKNTTSAIDSAEVSSKLGSEDFVAIRLESGSESYRQFVQIYQLVPIPSLFFIGKNGEPVEILAGERTSSELCVHIDKVLEKCGKKSPTSVAVDNAAAQEVSQSNPEPIVKKEATENVFKETPVVDRVVDPPKPSEDDMLEEAVSEKKEPSPVKEEPKGEVPDKDEAVAQDENEPDVHMHVEQLIAQRRVEREAKEKAKELEREEQRKHAGKEAARFRREQEEKNIRIAQKERERQKAEEKAARERILQQIAMDRAEQSARYEAEKNAAKKRKLEEDQRKAAEEQEKAAALAAARSNTARIQFRLPDGTSHTHQFDAGSTLADVRAYVKANLTLPFRNFSMSLAFPRREFTAEDDLKTLRDLELAPSAAVLILPVTSSEITSSGPGGGGFSAFIWSIVSRFMYLFTILRGWVFGNGDSQDGQGASGGRKEDVDRKTQSGSSSISSPPPSMHGAIRRRGSGMSLTGSSTSSGITGGSMGGSTTGGEPSRMRREGNVHRLPTGRDGDSDDDNNTWNGNSTQQM